jgi:NAD(P)-dependent dehydrogenase (short-subunit alcohol dehydrogenase family)
MRLAGKVALITGAAQGIGEAIARRFAAEGATVFLADQKAAEGGALAAELSTEPAASCGKVRFLGLDVRLEADWVRALAAVAEAAGRLDVLVSNAGLNIREPIERMSDPERRAERVGEVPLGRLASLDDVASAFVYLASDEAAFINGVAFPVDGGLTAG